MIPNSGLPPRSPRLRVSPLHVFCMLTRCSAALRLPTLGYTFDFPFGHALSRGCSPLRYGCLVRSRSSRPSGCLRQATQPAPAGMCSPPVDFATLHPSGCLRQSISLRSIMSPFGLPAAGYPASAHWHVFSAALRLPPSLPVDFATLHPSGCLRQSISLRSIMSPYGLPAAGYPASARWHVFRFPVSASPLRDPRVSA